MSCVWNEEGGFLGMHTFNNPSVFNPFSFLCYHIKKNQVFTFPPPAGFLHSKLDCGTRYHNPIQYCNFLCSESIVMTVFASHLFNICWYFLLPLSLLLIKLSLAVCIILFLHSDGIWENIDTKCTCLLYI